MLKSCRRKPEELINASDSLVSYPLLTNGKYYSGGGGLNSTVKDYAIFLQMMLNGGEYNGVRILAPRTVELMTCNQIGDLFVAKNNNYDYHRSRTSPVGNVKGIFLLVRYF